MTRFVIVRVDDGRATHIRGDSYDALGQPLHQWAAESPAQVWPVPPDDRMTRDLREAVRIVESSGWTHRHDLVARIRAAYGLDEEEA